jgi:hypothetical protein
MKRKTLLGLVCLLPFTANSEDYDNTCKHNALHFATSVERLPYVDNLLNRSNFDITDLNKQCQTALHIAVETGNVEIIDRLLTHLYANSDSNTTVDSIVNGNDETLLQLSLLHHQPQSLYHLLYEHKANPDHVAPNGLSAYDYNEKYGNNLTNKIFDVYKADMAKIELIDQHRENSESLANLRDDLEEKEYDLTVELSSLSLTGNHEEVTQLQREIEELKAYISRLEALLREQGIALDGHLNDIDGSRHTLSEIVARDKVSPDDLMTHIPENSDRAIPEAYDPGRMPDISDPVLDDIYADEMLNKGNLIYELLSRPILIIEPPKPKDSESSDPQKRSTENAD